MKDFILPANSMYRNTDCQDCWLSNADRKKGDKFFKWMIKGVTYNNCDAACKSKDLGEGDKFFVKSIGNVLKQVGNAVKKGADSAIGGLIDKLSLGDYDFLKSALKKVAVDKDVMGGVHTLMGNKDFQRFVRHKFVYKHVAEQSGYVINEGAAAKITRYSTWLFDRSMVAHLEDKELAPIVTDAPEGELLARGGESQPLHLRIERLGKDGKTAICTVRFVFDCLSCYRWKEGKACTGVMTTRPVFANLTHTTPGGECESWFTPLDAVVRAAVGIATALETKAVYGGNLSPGRPGGRQCYSNGGTVQTFNGTEKNLSGTDGPTVANHSVPWTSTRRRNNKCEP